MQNRSDVKFIGVSIDELIESSKQNLKELEDSQVDPEVRKAYAGFLGSLHNQQARMSSYFFVYSKFIWLKLEF